MVRPRNLRTLTPLRFAPALVLALGAVGILDTACRGKRYFDPSLARASVESAFLQWSNANAVLDPGAATARGDHRTDRSLEPPTRERVASVVDTLRGAKNDLNAYWSEQAQADAQADHDLIVGRIDADLIAFDQLRIHERDLAWSAGVAHRALTSIEEAPDLTDPERVAALSARMRALPAYFSGVREVCRMPWHVQIEHAVLVTEALRDYVDSDPLSRFGDSSEDAARARDFAREAAKEHLEWLQQRLTLGPEGHHRVHRVLFEALLRAESGLDIDAPSVAEAAQAELEGARKRFEAAALAYRTAREPREPEDAERAVALALRAVAADRPLDGSTLKALAKSAVAKALAFSKSAALLTVPESLHVDASTVLGATDSGALAAAGSTFSERSRTTRAVVKVSTPIAVLPAAAREEWFSALSPARLQVLALAEGSPGLALLRSVQFQNASRIRRSIGCQGFDRGWSDYARRIAVEAGFGHDDPTVELASRSMDMLVAARALCAARIHAGSMTLTEAAEIFRRQAWCPPEVALLEARLCAIDPLVALQLVGRREVERLVADVASRRGMGAPGARDRILRTGSLPFPSLRRILLPDEEPNEVR